MTLISGGYHCPAVPDVLANAEADLHERRITLAVYKQRVQERVRYRMRTKPKPGPGTAERLTCPAAGPAPLVACPHKPASQTERPTRQPNGEVTDTRLRLTPVGDLAEHKPEVCAKESVTVTPEDGGKTRQPLAYGADEHTRVYNLLRQSQEGLHGFAKSAAHEALGDPGKRRVRGIAAQTLFAGFLLAAASIRKIRMFLRKAEQDPASGDIYVTRTSRNGDHAPTDLPGGLGLAPQPAAITPPPADDPPPT